MTRGGRINYAKAKRRARVYQAGPVAGTRLFHRDSLRGWRTEYPEQFPVIVTRKEDK